MQYVTREHIRVLETLAGKTLPLPPPQRVQSRRGGIVEVWEVGTVRAAIVAAWLSSE